MSVGDAHEDLADDALGHGRPSLSTMRTSVPGSGAPTPTSSSASRALRTGTARPALPSAARSTRSTTRRRQQLGNVTATVASASP